MYLLNLSRCSFTRGKVPETPILHKHILIFVQNLWFKKQKQNNHYNTSNVPHIKHIKQHTTAVQRHTYTTHTTHTQVKRAEMAKRFYLLRARKRNDAQTLLCAFTCCDCGSGLWSPDRPKSCNSGSVLSSAGAAPVASLSCSKHLHRKL